MNKTPGRKERGIFDALLTFKVRLCVKMCRHFYCLISVQLCVLQYQVA